MSTKRQYFQNFIHLLNKNLVCPTSRHRPFDIPSLDEHVSGGNLFCVSYSYSAMKYLTG